jgi:hypothetical protein
MSVHFKPHKVKIRLADPKDGHVFGTHPVELPKKIQPTSNVKGTK